MRHSGEHLQRYARVTVHIFVMLWAALASSACRRQPAQIVVSLPDMAPPMPEAPDCHRERSGLADRGDWVEITPLPPGSPARHCANSDGCGWSLLSHAGIVTAAPITPRRGPPDVPEAAIRQFCCGEGAGDIYRQRVEDGWIVGYNEGEFGGGVRWFSADWKSSYAISDEHIIGLVETPAGLLAPAGLDHGAWCKGGVLRIERGRGRGRYEARWLGRFPTAACAFVVDGADLLVASSRGVIKVDGEGTLKILHEANWESLYPNQIAIGPDRSIYVAIRGAIVHLTRRPGSDDWSDRWLVPADCPLMEEIPHKPFECRCRRL